MRQSYQRERGRQYLILSEEKEQDESYRTRMIQENRVEGCLDCHIHRVDEVCYFCYDVTSLQPLSELFSYRKIEKRTLIRLLENIAAAVRNLEQYLLPADGIVLKTDCVFGTPDLGQFVFCYYPFYQKTFAESLRGLSVELLTRLDQKDQETVMFGYSFYQVCTEESTGEQAILRMLASEMDCPDPMKLQEKTEREYYEQAKKEERDRILDDFFREEDGGEETKPEEKRGKQAGSIILLIGSIALGFAVSRTYSLEAGLGAGIICAVFGFLIAGFFRRPREKRDEDDEEDAVIKSGNASGDRSEWPDIGEEMPETEERDRDVFTSGEEEPDGWMFRADEKEGEERTGGTWRPEPEDSRTGWEDRREEAPAYGRETVILSGKPHGTASNAMLVLYEKGNPDHPRIPLGEKSYILGSSREAADIRLASAAVSRMHAKLTREEKGYEITDLRSRNGTYLNGKEIVSAGRGVLLSDGDRIRLADCEVVYTCS